MTELANFEHEYLSTRTDDRLIFAEFKKPLHENIFYINKKGIIYNETTRYIKFNETTWERNPQRFSNDTYGIPAMYLIILLINEIPSQFGFISERFSATNIITPTMQVIINVLSSKI